MTIDHYTAVVLTLMCTELAVLIPIWKKLGTALERIVREYPPRARTQEHLR